MPYLLGREAHGQALLDKRLLPQHAEYPAHRYFAAREVLKDFDFKTIIDEAEFHLSEDSAHETFVAMLMALPDHHEREMKIFLDHPRLRKGATHP